MILAGAEQEVSSRGDLVLKQPTAVAVFNAIQQALVAAKTATFTTDVAEASQAA